MANKGVKRNTKGGKRPHMDSVLQITNGHMKELKCAMAIGQDFGIQVMADFFQIEMLEAGISAKKCMEISANVGKSINEWDVNYWDKDMDNEKTYSLSILDRKLQPATERAGKPFIPHWERYASVINYLKGCKTQYDFEYQERERSMVAMSDVEKKLREKIVAATKKLKTTKDPKLRDGLLSEIEATEKLLEDIHGGL